MPMTPVSKPISAAGTGSQPNVSQAGPRVAAVGATAASTAVHSGSGAPTTAAPAQGQGLAQSVSAQALLTLIQTLGKPLPGVVLPNGTSGSGSLPLQIHAPSGQNTPAQPGSPSSLQVQGGANAPDGGSTPSRPSLQLTTVLPLPKGATIPAPGTAVLVDAQADGATSKLSVTVQGSPQPTANSLRADAARQNSLVPLMADLASLSANMVAKPGAQQRQNFLVPLMADLTSSPGSLAPKPGAQALDQAIGRLMGFVLKGDSTIPADALRSAVEGARGMPSPTLASTGNAPSSANSAGMQNALAALVRALGLSSAGPAQPAPQNTGQTAPPQSSSQALASGTPSQSQAPLPENTHQPSKLPAQTLPPDAPDLSDPAQLAALKTKAEAGLSRLNLLQSRANDQSVQTLARGGESVSLLRWDVPLLIGQEAALLGVAIERDGEPNRGEAQAAQTWRFRFAFQSTRHGEIEGLVALHTHGLYDERPGLDIGVWAADATVLRQLDSNRTDLIATLQGFGLGIDSLTLGSLEEAPAAPETQSQNNHLVDVVS